MRAPPAWTRALAVAAALLGACRRGRASDATVRVAAAADLSLAFEAIGRDFERQTGTPVVFSFGSSGLLAKQLREGAPFDVFAAANESFVDQAVAAGACDAATKAHYARGRLAVVVRPGLVPPPEDLADLASARFVRIAIANPEHAPYGKAAWQALERAGLLRAVEPKLVLGENVRQSLQLAETGNADAAIVALALVAVEGGTRLVIDQALYQPIDQTIVICRRGGQREAGERFARFVQSEVGRGVLQRYGYSLPDETPTAGP